MDGGDVLKVGECLAAYRRHRQGVLLLLLVFWLTYLVVYTLYGLPAGPYFYGTLLTAAFSLVAAALDFYAFYKKLRRLSGLRGQDPMELGQLPKTRQAVDLEYQALVRLLELRLREERERSRRAANHATHYYTLWSHQIKTPLAAMRLLLREEPCQRTALSQELFKTEQYVDMVLQYQRLDGGARDLVFIHCDLDALVRRTVKKTAPLFIHNHVSLELGDLSCTVLTDEKWLEFVLEQLFTNAVKYTPAGRVSVSLVPGRPAMLVVEDTGIGIAPEDLPRVFEWGYTGYNGRLGRRSTGIGLSLCKQALDLLGHSIAIESRQGSGTKVLLDLSRHRLETE